MTLLDIFEALPPPEPSSTRDAFTARVIRTGPLRLARDLSGSPALLIPCADPRSAPRPAPLELEHVRVDYDLPCLVHHPDGAAEDLVLTVVRCRQADRVLAEYFLRVIDAVIPRLGDDPRRAVVHEATSTLAELFRALTQPALKSVRGLWAELFVIADAADPELLLDSWHATPADRFDFSRGRQRIEVKSCSTPERRPFFALEQLHPPGDTEVLVASLFIDRAGGGVSVGDLSDRIRTRVGSRPDLILRMDQLLAASLGNEWRAGLRERFDWEKAQASLQFHHGSDVPSVALSALPAGVSEVRFRSDLTLTPPAPSADLTTAGGLFKTAVPRRARWQTSP